jgi:hypothetical protein
MCSVKEEYDPRYLKTVWIMGSVVPIQWSLKFYLIAHRLVSPLS